MTSERGAAECFVYITLPGRTEAITAGRLQLRVSRAGAPLGRFVYGRQYLERDDAVEFDPVELKLSPRTYETARLQGVFGALRDASPDYWGRRVIERNAGRLRLGEMDYLLLSPDDRAGALGFGLNQTPPAPRRTFNQTLDLAKVQRIADALVADGVLPVDAASRQVEELLLIGTSMGGGRPKAVVEDRDGLWIAKFNRADDRWNHARVEHAMLVLARSCGITTAESRVVSVARRDVLLAKRFDRELTQDGYLRARMVSGLTPLGAEEVPTARDEWSYVRLAEELPARERESGGRCAGALPADVLQRADFKPRRPPPQSRAHREEPRMAMSPAYDLNPTPAVSVERRDLAMVAGDAGRFANAQNLVSQCARFLLDRPAAERIVRRLEKCVKSTWYQVARAAGVSERDCTAISGAFAYPGFGAR